MKRINNCRGLQRLLPALRYAWQGLKTAFQQEAAFRQEILLAIILVPIALWIGDKGVEQILLIGSVLLILIIELLNTSIEAMIDRISLDPHPLSKQAKDIASAAVFLTLLLAIMTWLLIIGGKFY